MASAIATATKYFQKDRLRHGLGLGYEAFFYDRGAWNVDKRFLESAIRYLKKAAEEYASLLDKVQQLTVRNLIVRNLMGISNSLVDTYIQLYYIENRAQSIQIAREYLLRIKDYADTLQVEYDRLAIVNNTEAELEYCEALLLTQRKEIGMARKKLGYAFKRFNKSIARDSSMHPKFKELILKLERLRSSLKSG